MERPQKKYEEYAYVLDELPHGRPGAQRSQYHGRAVIQIVGDSFFTLLEAVPYKNAVFASGERIYVGKKGRTKVEHILGRIAYEDLTSGGRAELPIAVEAIIRADEARFINFFNSSQPLTPRMHAMELIPGIGKRLMWQIIEQRDRVPFDGFDDLQSRVNLTDPVKLLGRRILQELSEEEKYQLFVRPG
jgi:putative nucleotide binding protein